MREDIQKFLVRTNGSIEASLMILQNEQELLELEQEVADFGFQKTKNVREIFNAIKEGKKLYFILSSDFGNNIYNIIAQYSTGQVTAYDGKNNLVANPNYQKGAVLILITKENLEKIEKSGKSLLKLAGISWQK